MPNSFLLTTPEPLFYLGHHFRFSEFTYVGFVEFIERTPPLQIAFDEMQIGGNEKTRSSAVFNWFIRSLIKIVFCLIKL